jgi:hypothetical protein
MSTETSVSPKRVRTRVARRKRRDPLPPAYRWVKGVAVFWLFLGVLFLFAFGGCAFMRAKGIVPLGFEWDFFARMMWYYGFFALIHIVIPIGILRRAKWSFYAGLALTSLFLLGFPLGTILGLFMIKAFADAKLAFGVL